MPSDDLVLNVRQVAGYSPTANAPPSSALLIQLGGLGGPYASISPQDLVSTALSTGGDMAIAGGLAVQALQGGSAQFSNAAVGLLSAQKACIVDLAAGSGTVGGARIATANDLAAMVSSVNGRVGAVVLGLDDIIRAGGAPIYSPYFSGCPQAPTPPIGSASNAVATTWFVMNAIGSALAAFPTVSSFNGRTGDVVLTDADIVAALAGATIPYAPLASPNFSGIPTAPTPAQGSNTGQLATTAFVMNAVADSTAGVVSFNTRTGVVTLQSGDITAAGGALLLSPALTGLPTAPTASVGTSTTQLATTAFVMTATGGGGYAPLASPAFTGVPTAPTAANGTNTPQIATTGFVMNELNAIDAGVLSFNGRSGVVSLLANDISAAGGAVLASPAFTGLPTAPTAVQGTVTSQLATCAFVAAALAAGGGVQSFNARTGAVSLTQADVIGALPASATNPVMNGTAAPGSSTAWSRGDHVHPVDTSRAAASALANYLPLGGGTLTGNLLGTTAGFSTSVQAPALISTENGVRYQAFAANAVAFAWGGGGAGAGLRAFVDGAQQGYVVRSGDGAPPGSFSAIDQMGLNGAGPSVVWAFNGGNVSVGVTFSDRRLKSNVQPATVDALDLIDRLKVYEADLRNPLPGGQPQHWDCSLIADELDEVIPHARIKASGAEGSFDGVNAYPIVCVLVRAVQQLTARLAALEARTA